MAGKAMHMAEVSNDCKPERINKMGSTIFDSFAKLTNETEFVRLDGGITLLKHLLQQRSDQEDIKEFKYAITRIIRSLGSSKNVSRKGFYTTLTVFLTMHPETSIEKILSIMEAELHPVNSNNKSENADIYMGRILTYGSLIRSKLLPNKNDETQTQVIGDLIKSGKQRSYLSFISTLFLVEFLNQIDAASAKRIIWPIVEKEFGKPWSEQTLDSFYILLAMRQKFPSLVNHKFLKKHLDSEDIVTNDAMENIVKVLTDLPRIISCRHPVFKLFCEKLTTVDLITNFWGYIDQRFMKPSKSDEHLAIELFKQILSNVTEKSVLPSLLSRNFLQHMLKRFSNCRKHDGDEVLMGFKESLNLLVSTITSKDTTSKSQIGVLKRLILYPGDLMIERKTGTKVIQTITTSLSAEGVKKLSKLYRDIIENKIPKEQQNAKSDTFWTNVERIYAGQLLTRLIGHSSIIADQEWRIDQLKFLFNHGLCEIPNVGTELAPQFKETFYRALDHKLPKLNDLRNVLSTLVHHLNSKMNSSALTLRSPLSDEAKEAWDKVIQLIEKLENTTKKTDALPVFHTMNLQMGLQLFSDPDMAIMSINELESCYERLIKKTKKQRPRNGKKETDEPEWVEVVVDLLLSLLSRNNHLLRSLVGCVFPHICPYVTPAAIHQILAALDVKNEKGPLVTKNGLDNEESSDAESNSDGGSDDEDDEENSTVETDNTTEDSDSDSNGESMDEEEDETITDRVRLAVRQALGDATIQTDDEDMDVDQIGEEEGKRLDESLAAAFRILRENRQSRSKKQEKSAQALTHFRVRVIDLLEAYLESVPSMAIALDMLIPLFVLLEYCIKDPHQKPLQCRVRSCLKKLSLVKKFKDTEGVDEELLTVILKALIEKGERTASVYHEMGDKLAECCTLLVRCAQQADLSTDAVVQIYGENITAFFKKRDCVLPALLFRSILQLHWEGNWQLAPLLVDFAFDSTVRSFRRGLALEFLTIFYKNGRLVHSDTEHVPTRMMIEKKLCENTISMLNELSNAQKDDEQATTNSSTEIGKEVKQRFVCLLLKLLHTIHTQHLPQAWRWKDVGTALTTYRTQVSFAKDAKKAYNKLASQIGISIKVPTKKTKEEQQPRINGHAEKNDVEEMEITQENGNTDSEEEAPQTKSNEAKKKKKHKSKQKDRQILKKEARLLREKKMSEGFEAFQFSSFTLPSKTEENEVLQNGDAEGEELSPNSSQKRMLSHSSDVGSKPKKKKRTQSA